MSFNFEQRLDCLGLIQEINNVLTAQDVAQITQHYGLPASITEAGDLWPQMRMRGQFNENEVWDLREFLIKLSASDPTNHLVPIINEIGYYHNCYRAWQHNDSIANHIVALRHDGPAVPILAPVILNQPESKTSHYEIPNQKHVTLSSGTNITISDGSNRSPPMNPVGLRGIPGPLSEPSPAINLLGPLVAGSVGIPYYNHKRHDEVPIEEKEKECRLCMTNEKYVAIQPCGCVCLCGDCALSYNEKTCLNCKGAVTYLQGLRSV